MTEGEKPFFYVPRFLTEKESATFLKVCEVLKDCTLEEIKDIFKAIDEIAPKYAIFRQP